MTAGRRTFRRGRFSTVTTGLVIIAVVAAIMAMTTQVAAAATPTMTELQAERFVARYVTYTDSDKLAEYNQNVADAKAAYQRDCIDLDQSDVFNRSKCSVAKSNLNGFRGRGCQCHYVASRVDCRGASPSKDAYHFARLRCKALFVSKPFDDAGIAGWGQGYVKPLSATRARWTSISS